MREFKGGSRDQKKSFAPKGGSGGYGERKSDSKGKSFGDKKLRDKKFGDKKFGDKKFGDRKPSDRKFGDKKRPDPRVEEKPTFEKENLVYGRNPVLEVFKSGRTIERLYVQESNKAAYLKKLIGEAKERGAVIVDCDKDRLDKLCAFGVHQGVAAIVSEYKYFELEELVEHAKSKGETPLIVVIDELQDPHNLGSIIRSAEVFGAHGIVIPKRRSATLTPTVIKASAGATEHMKISKVTNLGQAIDILKDLGLWIASTDMEGEDISKVELTVPLALIIGGEDKGVSRIHKEKSDFVVNIPMKGNIGSLNASVAASIALYEISKMR